MVPNRKVQEMNERIDVLISYSKLTNLWHWHVGILFSSFNGYLETEECENNAKEVMEFLGIKKYRIKY